MSAAGRREELEAAVHLWLGKMRRQEGDPSFGACAILAAVDRYATSLAAEELDRFEGRARLDVADAEYHGRQP